MPVFNADNTEWQDGNYSLFMGQAPALFDSINVNYPKLETLYKKQISQRWVSDEFDHSQSRMDLSNCPKSVYQVMLMNLAYQWEADSVAARSIAPLLAPFVTNSELWAVLMENTNMEITHALTYSEIVRQCVQNPKEVFAMVMESEQTLARADTVNRVFDDLALVGAEYTQFGKESYEDERMHQIAQRVYNTVFKALCALYMLERVQFMGSFAATFAIVEQGYFQSIGKAVQKIMLDEVDCHSATDLEIIRIELQTLKGQRAIEQCEDEIKDMLIEVIEQEFSFADHLFSEGRSIVGLNPVLLKEWILYNAFVVADDLSIKLPYDRPTVNPLPWMENYIDIDKTQNANQEATGNNYALNVVQDDLGDEELEF